MQKILELALGFVAFISAFVGTICLCFIPIDIYQLWRKSNRKGNRTVILVHGGVMLFSWAIVYGATIIFGYFGLNDESRFMNWIKYSAIILLLFPTVALPSVIIPFTVAGTFAEASKTHDWHIYFKGLVGVVLELLIFSILYWLMSCLGFSLSDFLRDIAT